MSKRAYRIVGSALVIVALGACGQQAASTPNAGSSDMAGMDHSGMNHGGSASGTTATATAPFDAMFIDGMTVHHQGAITMAQQALSQAEHDEVKQLAQEIVTAQEREIEQMRDWRTQWYAGVPATSGMAMDMGDMRVSDDTRMPFDQRFLAAMIGHHQGAIDMAREALTQAEHSEIKQLAQEIITAQEREIAQMRGWQQQWYGVQ